MNHGVARELDRAPVGSPAMRPFEDYLSRPAYAILGIPIDAIDMAATVRKIEQAAATRTPLLISTVNLNFLIASQDDEAFRESLLASDLCVADGMPVLWIARLLGVPIRERVAGSDLLQALREAEGNTSPFTIFFFGGQEGVAEQACQRINAKGDRLTCVGAICPGFCSIEEMSSESYIEAINASKADFLVVALGARKGQAWLRRNHAHLQVPVRSHLGATVNFQAGTLRRAPAAWQRMGLEWLWRITEEPQLAGRYWRDGIALLSLLLTRILPLAIHLRWNGFRHSRTGGGLTCERRQEKTGTHLVIAGTASGRHTVQLRQVFREAVADRKPVTLELGGLEFADPLFFGLVHMLRKELRAANLDLKIGNLSDSLKRLIRMNSLDCLLTDTAPGAGEQKSCGVVL